MLSTEQIQSFKKQYSLGTPIAAPRNTVADLFTGFAKGAGETLKTVGTMAASGAENLTAGPIVSKVLGNPLQKVVSAEQNAVGLSDSNLESKSTAESVGKGIEFAAELATPLAVSKIGKVTGILESALKSMTPKIPASAEIASGIVQRINRIAPTKQVKFKDMTGKSVGDWLTERGVVGTSDQTVTQLVKRMENSMSQVDTALASRQEVFKSSPALTALKELQSKATRTSSTGAVSPILERVNELTKKMMGEGLTLPEINEVKRLYEANVKLDYLKVLNPEGVQKANNIDSALRNFVVDEASKLGITNVTELNKETQAARFLIDEIGAASEGRAANNAVALTDWLLLAEGAANPTALAAYLGKKGISTESFQAWFARQLAPKAKAPIKASIVEPKPTLKDFLDKTSGQ